MRYANDYSDWGKTGINVLDFNFWQLYVSEVLIEESDPKTEGFEKLKEGIRAPYTFGDLTETYLSRDDLFQRVKALADANKIQAITADLNHPDEVTAIFDQLRKAKTKISAVDISNAFTRMYMRRESLQHLLKEISYLEPQTLLTVTDNNRDLDNTWTYHSWPAAELARRGSQKFYSSTFQWSPSKIIRKSPYSCVKKLKE